MVKAQTLKGFRDFLPKQARKRQHAISALRGVFESFGFEPLETPALEYEEVLSGKYGDEGDRLMYKFEDNGGRRVALRYDQTVPLARVIAQNQGILPTPFKRYQIQNVWRAENTQKGRYREFLQCDIDTVGVDRASADSEIITAAAKSYEALGITNYKILINDRAVFGDLSSKAIIIIDKLKKIGPEKVKEELKVNGFDPDALEKLENAPLPQRLDLIIKVASRMGVDKEKIEFTPTLARGLDYYTGTIIEIESPNYPAGALGGGGRYDKLIGMFGKNDIPAVGFSFGFDRIIEAMDELNLFPEDLSKAKILVTIFDLKLADKSAEIATRLRENKIKTELWLDPETKMEKQLRYANQKNISYVILLGPEEVKNNVVTLKNMQTREQVSLSLEKVINKLEQ